ncbi:hypothetical protein [Nitrosomonas sp. PY1]|uniref:hypothetical protein n=1 Tax=Nitrosomonas sp. PY1 TaxID=1803906 RepID=UPI001FC83341|nr:hypothetical protein [Nitrosomonas sp. PY1]
MSVSGRLRHKHFPGFPGIVVPPGTDRSKALIDQQIWYTVTILDQCSGIVLPLSLLLFP